MSAAAPPPTALNSDTSCGIAVIFTVRAVYRPSPPPSAMPARMMIQPVTLIVPVVGHERAGTAVPPIASAMPAADSRLPFRAVAGEFIRIRPSTNAGRADQPRQADDGLDGEVHRQPSGRRPWARPRACA